MNNVDNCTLETVDTVYSVNNDSNISIPDNNLRSFAKLNKIAYLIILPTLITVGIVGNSLNLLTLRHRALKSVPFRYIRSMAIFDVLGLSLLIFIVCRAALLTPITGYQLMAYYQAHVELPLLNAFLTASLFTAVCLTVIRYKFICHPHRRCSGSNPGLSATYNIVWAFLLAALIHSPMIFEYVPILVSSQCSSRNTFRYRRINNPLITKNGPYVLVYKIYQVIRECVRVGAVIMLTVLNLHITRSLNKAECKRRSMTSASSTGHDRRRRSSRGVTALLLCFADRKLTVVMATVTVVYIIGNIPAAILMILNDDSKQHSYSFHVFRAFANLAEISNHCVSFYIFCLTSRDYWQAFVDTFGIGNKKFRLIRLFRLKKRRSVEETERNTDICNKSNHFHQYPISGLQLLLEPGMRSVEMPRMKEDEVNDNSIDSSTLTTSVT